MKTGQIIRIECKRAFSSIGFWIALLIGCVLTLTEAFWRFEAVQEYWLGIQEGTSTAYSTLTALSQWFAKDWTVCETVFYMMFPLLAALPHAISLYQDKRSGYIKNLLLRTTKRRYLVAKCIAVFFSGGAVVFLPLAINFFVTTLYVPLRVADPLNEVMVQTAPFLELFFEHGLLYTFLILGLSFMTAGLFATTSLVATSLMDNFFTTLTFPFLLLMLLYNVFMPLQWFGFIPFYYLWPETSVRGEEWHIVLLLVLLFLTVCLVMFGREQQEEIF